MRSRTDLSRLAAALGGLPILGCLEGSPAAEAGVRYGDILLAIDDIPTATWDDFLRARSQSRGRFVARIFRDGVESRIAVELRASTRTPLEMLTEVAGQNLVEGDDSGGGGVKN
jgi:S1-C subfamily serine protease